jgi:hypothetical protein
MNVNLSIASMKTKIMLTKTPSEELSDSLLSYQSSKPFTHSQIIIVTIAKTEWHSTGSNLSAVKAGITAERLPRALLFAAADAILVTRQPVSVGLRGRWTVAVVAVVRGIDDRAEAAASILIHPIGVVLWNCHCFFESTEAINVG